VKGSALVDGTNHIPTGWGTCGGYPTDPVPAVYAAHGAKVDGEKNLATTSPDGKVVHSDDAGDEDTYVNFGSETWTTLASNADIKIKAPDAANFKTTVQPEGDNVKCEVKPTNWGEPWRGASSVKGCYNRFPIIYSEGDLHLNSNARGQGVLLVNGSLKLNGKFEFYGLVIVRDEIEKNNGTSLIMGAVLVRNASLGSPSWLGGNQDTFYSKCAVENALRGSAILVRAKERSWAQLY